MKTAEEYAKQFKAEKASTDATRKAERNVYKQEDADPQMSDTGSTSTLPASDFNPSDYGLTKVQGGSKDDGVVTDGLGNYYAVDNFERQQNSGSDTDQGDVFDSDLYKTAKDAGFGVTSFNTINDVEGAIKYMAGQKKDPGMTMPDNPDTTLQDSIIRIDQREDDIRSGAVTDSIFGRNPASDDYAINFTNQYKQDVKNQLAPVNPFQAGSETQYALNLQTESGRSPVADAVINERKKRG